MAWVRIDDQFFFKPRTRAVGKEGRSLFVAGLCYCAANLTDGRIDRSALPLVTAMAEVRKAVAERLVDAGLWADHGDHLEVLDYLDYHPTREEELAKRAAGAERQRRSRQRRSSQGESHGDDDPASRVTDDATNGVTSRDPSPSPTGSKSSSSSTPSNGNLDDENLPSGLWEALADRKAKVERNVRNPKAWKAKVAANAATELTPRAHELVDTYVLTKSQLVDVLLSDTSPPWLRGLERQDHPA